MGETIGKKIKELRLSKGMTLEELGNRVGVGKSTVRKWETGEIANMRRDKIQKLADALDIPVGKLMGWPNSDKKTKASLGVSAGMIPVLSEIPCGTSTKVYANITDDVVEIEESLAQTGEYYGLRAKGDSMLPKIEPGDIMIIHAQNHIESGQVAIVKVDGEVTCKRIKKYRDGLELIGINPTYQPQFFTKEEIKEKPIEIVGRVMEVRSKL